MNRQYFLYVFIALPIVAMLAMNCGYAKESKPTNKAPLVKKSESGICHKKGSTYYKKTKTFTPYNSMEACLKSGGRKPKR